ncbi:MAG: hypothetical protein ACP5N7_03145 [Candidatus Pacearchaeota archaeon]
MRWLVFSILFIGLFSLSVSAEETCITFNSTNTLELISDIPSISYELSSCNIALPEQISSLLNNKNVLISINMNSGSVEKFYLSIVDGYISSLNPGQPETYSYNIILSETTLDNILSSENMVDSLILAYNNDQIVVDPSGVWNNVVWFFASWFI